MEGEEDPVKKQQIVDARARNISHNVRCTECGSQSIEDSQADIAILLRKLIRDEIHSGKSDKEIFKKLEDEFGETVLYAPKFDKQTAVLWLSPVCMSSVIGLYKCDSYLCEYDYTRKGKSKSLNTIVLIQLLVAGVAAGGWAYKRHRQKTNVHIMALNLVRGVPLTPKEKETMLQLLTPPPSERTKPSFWLNRLRGV